MTVAPSEFLLTPQGNRLAYQRLPGRSPGILFLTGFQSDKGGTKAGALADWCRREERSFIRFDYSGHGDSSGEFSEGTIGEWLADALVVFDKLADERQILVGSSMGGWIALLLALQRPERVAGILTIACAADFTERRLLPALTSEQLARLQSTGRIRLPSAYREDDYVITRRLIEEGRNHLLLDGEIPIHCPVRLVHGDADHDIPWETSLQVMERLASSDVRLLLVKNSDHRLSGPADIRIIEQLAGELVADTTE